MTNRRLTALGLLGVALCATSIVIAHGGAGVTSRPGHTTIAVGTLAGLLGVGLYAWSREAGGRFGKVLFATGIAWFFVTFSNSDTSLLYSVGRISAWVFEVVLAYALLSYPTGRLEGKPARRVVLAGALLVAILYLPTIPFTTQFQLPAPFGSCAAHCPQNYFSSGSEPDLVADLIKPLREPLAIAVYLGLVWVIAGRLRRAGRNERRTLTPVLGAATLRFAAAIAYVALRRAGAGGMVLDGAALVAALSVPAIALGFFFGLVRWRVYSAAALGRLTTGLAETRTPLELRGLLVRSLEEPAVEICYREPPDPRGAVVAPSWLDSSGSRVPAPSSAPGRCVREAGSDSGLRVALVCEAGFRDRPEFLDAVCACVVSGLERQRLDAALAASLADVAASRKRLVGAADGARQKIERDLHDGAQQQLVALRVKLELAREALEADSETAVELVASLGPEVEGIIEEVRSLARGIYPALLASDGLGEALRAAGQRLPVPARVEADGVGRLPAETESAVYFCCLEAMQNVAKHAEGATAVRIALGAEDELRFEVVDDGCGFLAADAVGGLGLTGMRDRLAAVGGELSVESTPGAGTRVRGRVPLD